MTTFDTTTAGLNAHDGHGHHDAGPDRTKLFGFWLYLMTDCLIFAGLFAVFAVMHDQFAGGPTGKDLIEIQDVALETAILLFSSITYGFAMVAAHQNKVSTILLWLVITFLLGAAFIGLEIKEFSHMVSVGAGPDRSAFLSAFFTLVGTHGLHVSVGLLWMVLLMVQLVGKKELTGVQLTRLSCLSMFWHFLDVVWICVFTFVYLMSVVL
ncbi:cytochrome o ubiquinol oxidase subunit III [Entomobacter blattae]|uniref:Cytochrome bo(3) ubiquinol oxidase subunit 3 n=1 Tax=Entomobacter blattae TaxID=2762277 RepID=A0A7H1NRY1_9PROT|nr:cytochrome o ubiquinol oxidase subunit III [Entomobacter blattae]QNT78541.1 Cytochrome bo(3) ubiquinol oxidase subunit 3 [Entomobacter blattae]